MSTPIELAGLSRALGVERGELISLVGGGGKTTTLFTLGAQLAGTTVLTTTTKMGAEQTGDDVRLVDPSDEELAAALLAHERVLAWQEVDERRAIGVSADRCDRWFELADNVVVEADGSRKRPFKAPAAHEPVLPARTTLLVACIGASAFGRPIEASCHRPALVAGLAGCAVTDVLTPSRAAAVLLSTEGSRKDQPVDARFAVALHRVTPADASLVNELRSALDGQAKLIPVLERTSD